MTSEAMGGQLQSCYTARARPKCLTEEKCFKITLEQSQKVPDGRSGATEREVSEVSSGSRSVVVVLLKNGGDVWIPEV